MTPKRKQRLAIVFLIVLGVGSAVALAVTAFQGNLMYFFTPSEVVAGEAPLDRTIRIGGMVEKGSIQRQDNSLKIHFSVTDYAHQIPVKYEGILPDLFREEQGVVAFGKIQADGSFLASKILAKHDENYMPPEVARGLKRAEKEKAELEEEG